MPIYNEAKLAHDMKLRAERKAARRARKDARRPARRCFWQIPLGHRWVKVGKGYTTYKCVGCGKTKERYY